MSTKAKVSASLSMATDKWDRDLKKGKENLKAWSREIQAMKLQGPTLSPDSGGFRNGARYVLDRYQHLRGAATDLAAAAVRAAGAPAQYADMTDALNAVTGSAKEAREALSFLASVSEEQKLEFEPLVSAYEHMRALGFTAQQTQEFVREMGNAIEFSGGQASQITDLAGAFERVADKAGVSVRAVSAMGQSMPFLRTILKEQFGSATAADIEKLKLSSGELFEGIVRGLKRVETSQGGKLDAMSPDYLASANRLRLGRAGTGENPLLPDLPERTAAGPDPEGDAGRLESLRQRAARQAEADAEKKRAAGEAELQREQKKLELEIEIARAAAAADEQRKEELEDQLALMESAASKAKEMGVSEERAAAFILKQLDARRAIERVRNEATREAEKATAEVDRLRSRGHNRAADRLEESQTKAARVKEIMQGDPGMKKADAEAQAEREAGVRRDAAFRDRTGRNRIHGARSRNTVSGLDEFSRFRDSALRPETPVLDSDPFTQRRMRPQTPTPDARPRPRDNPPPEANGGKGGSGFADMIAALKTGLATVTAKLEELKNANAAPVADAVKPVNG